MSEFSGNVPRLPEHYKKRRMIDMWPDETVHLYSGAVVADKDTGYLFINRHNTLEEDAAAPTYYGNRVGIMRIYAPVDGELKDGFIADLRFAVGGHISEQMVTAPEAANEFDKKMVEQQIEEHKFEPLLAAIVLNIDGEEQYIGDPSLVPSLARLRGIVESIRGQKPEATEPAVTEQVAEVVTQPSLFEFMESNGLEY